MSEKPDSDAQMLQRIKNDDALLTRDERRTMLRMNALIREYERQCGNISSSCENAGVSRRAYYRWINGTAPIHLRFQRKIARILPRQRLADAAEAVILHHLNNKDLTAAIFTAKAHAGWSDRPDVISDRSKIIEDIGVLKAAVERRALEKGIPIEQELRNFLDRFGERLKPELKTTLASELIQ